MNTAKTPKRFRLIRCYSRTYVHALEREIAELRGQLDGMQGRVRLEEATSSQLRGMLADRPRAMRKLEADIDDLRTEVTELKQRNAYLGQQLESKQATMREGSHRV